MRFLSYISSSFTTSIFFFLFRSFLLELLLDLPEYPPSKKEFSKFSFSSKIELRFLNLTYFFSLFLVKAYCKFKSPVDLDFSKN
jgi:hypothetical protein